jgi:isoquinoline 1-oxidoreductase beta subunit
VSNRNDISRRALLKVMGGAGASLVIGIFPVVSCASPGKSGVLEPNGLRPDATPSKKTGVVFEPSAFIKIDPDGSVTIVITRSDMGQGVRTSLAMLVAEELDVDWKMVKVLQADSSSKYGRQGTGGSSSITGLNHSLREAGAAARAMLVAAAATEWGVDPSTIKTESGNVIHAGSGKKIPYSDLTAAAATETLPTGGGIQLKDPSEFKIIGKPTTRVDNHDVVTGKAIYGIDVKVPGMAYAVIARPPSFGGELESVDDAAAKRVPGVIDVQKFGSGVAVIATNTWAAISGRDALKLTWKPGPNSEVTSKSIRDSLVAAVTDHLPVPSGAKIVEATYDFPFLAHATMEPMNAVADVKGDQCTVWAPTQVPNGAQGAAADAAGVPRDNVTVNVTLLGGGFGRRLQTDFISEAAGLSKQTGKPIKLLWTREDDMQNDFYRPSSHHSFKGALDSSGTPLVWSHQAIQANGNSRAKFGGAGLPYKIDTARMLFGGVDVPVRIGPWRSVEHSLLNVANECFIDELARAAGKDPFEFRRDLISDDRLKAVLVTAAEKSGWDTPLPKGHGRGIACFSGYGSYVAHVVELSVENGQIKLRRVVAAVDCGLAINPKGVEAQIQGAITDGLSTALRAQITIDKGGVVQTSWPSFKWMTLDAMPVVEVHRVESPNSPGGMGESGYPSAPAAVANAIAAATGKKVRKFPIKLEELA